MTPIVYESWPRCRRVKKSPHSSGRLLRVILEWHRAMRWRHLQRSAFLLSWGSRGGLKAGGGGPLRTPFDYLVLGRVVPANRPARTRGHGDRPRRGMLLRLLRDVPGLPLRTRYRAARSGGWKIPLLMSDKIKSAIRHKALNPTARAAEAAFSVPLRAAETSLWACRRSGGIRIAGRTLPPDRSWRRPTEKTPPLRPASSDESRSSALAHLGRAADNAGRRRGVLCGLPARSDSAVIASFRPAEDRRAECSTPTKCNRPRLDRWRFQPRQNNW